MLMSLRRVFGHVVKTGHLTVREPDGRHFTYGDRTGEEIVVRVADRLTALRLALDPDLSVGECYMDGSLSVDRGTIYDFLALVMSNASPGDAASRGEDPASDPPRAAPASPAQPDRAGAAAMWRIITTSTAASTISSSIATANIPAPISRRRTPRSKTPSWPRSAISPPSSRSSPACGCSTSARAGAGSGSIWRRPAAPRSSA